MSTKKIVLLVESGAKARKIASFLPDNFVVLASFGHVTDLKKKELAIDVDDNFKPTYKIVQDRNNLRVVSKITDVFKKCQEVIFAADDDREGEAIAWHLHRLLYKNDTPVECNRITFNEITKDVILESLKNKRPISMPVVNAYQARRIIDRLVGFKFSPLLWKYIDTPEKSLSAGRCQSAILLLLKNHQDKIKGHKSEYSYDFKCKFLGFKNKNIKLDTDFKFNKLYRKDPATNTRNTIIYILKIMSENRRNFITKNNRREKKESAPQPFITSTIQQAAQNELGFSIDSTMKTLQKLYEKHGLITYHRTDSKSTSVKFQMEELAPFISKKFGKDYYNVPKVKKVKGAQEAHEAIRVTHLGDYKTLDKIEGLTDYDKKLYLMVFKRTVQSHMSPAIYDELSFELSNDAIKMYGAYTGIIKILREPGYLEYNRKFGKIHDKYKKSRSKTKDTLDKEDKGDKGDKEDKDINNAEYMRYFRETPVDELVFDLQTVDIKKVEKNPPSYHSESSLVKKQEDEKIGRPSTYASVIKILYDRKYVEVKDIIIPEKEQEKIKLSKSGEITESIGKIKSQKQKKKLVVTELGEQVITYLDKEFHEQIDIPFTAKVEANLDRIAEGEVAWQEVVREVYDNFMPIVTRLNAVPYKKKSHTLAREKWASVNTFGKYKDGRDIYIKSGKFGPYIQLLNSETSKTENISLQKYLQDNGIDKLEDSSAIDTDMIINYIDDFYKYKKTQKKNHRSLGKHKGVSIYLKIGKYGPYIQAGEGKNGIKPKFISMKGYYFKKKINPSNIKDIKELGDIKIGDIDEYLK